MIVVVLSLLILPVMHKGKEINELLVNVFNGCFVLRNPS